MQKWCEFCVRTNTHIHANSQAPFLFGWPPPRMPSAGRTFVSDGHELSSATQARCHGVELRGERVLIAELEATERADTRKLVHVRWPVESDEEVPVGELTHTRPVSLHEKRNPCRQLLLNVCNHSEKKGEAKSVDISKQGTRSFDKFSGGQFKRSNAQIALH